MSTYAYATLARLRARLNQTRTDLETDVTLCECLEGARDLIDVALAFSFFSVDVDTGAVDAWPVASSKIVAAVPSDHWLRLPAYKAGTVTSVTAHINGAMTTISDWAEDWDGGRFCLYRAADASTSPATTSGLWADGPYTVSAVYGFGPPPPAVREINLQLAVNLFRARDKGGYEVVGGGPQSGASLAIVGQLSDAQRAALRDINRQYVDWVDWGQP